MKQSISKKVFSFILKYTWIFCVSLVMIEVTSTVYSAAILMRQTAQGVLESVCGDISGRVDGVLRLLTGLAADERFSDIAKPLYDRVILARPYRDSYNLFMIALTDEDINVVSTNEAEPPQELFSLAHRDYLQRLYATGNYEITDSFPAGADNTTMNYTIAVPIRKDDVVKGSVFGSIYFSDIENILERSTDNPARQFFLLGSDNAYMAGCKKDSYGVALAEHAEYTHFFGTDPDTLDQNLRTAVPQHYWEWGQDGLCYITTMPVAPTQWSLLYQVQFSSVLRTLFPLLLVKTFFYLLLCLAISLFGRRYLSRQLTEVNHLMDKVTLMQKEIFHSEQTDYTALLEMTQKGLSDQLTGLPTRNVLSGKMQAFILEHAACAVLFLDMDNLKNINDNFGHSAGDLALVHFSTVLKQYQAMYPSLAARYGGDEFILILGDMEEVQVTDVAADICHSLKTVLKVNGANIMLSGSIGIALSPDHSTDAEELICKADFALYMAKQNGKNSYAFYDDSLKTILPL